MSTKPSKVCSDLEWKDEVDADERMKRKASSRRDSKVGKRNRKANKKFSTEEDTAATTDDKSGGKKRSKKQDGSKKKRSRSKGASSIKRVREQRRIEQTKAAKKAEDEEARKKARKSELELDYHPGNIIAAAEDKEEDAAAPEDFFWEVEAVVGRRVHRGRIEYLIRWKGCSEDDNTWEPTSNLCDTAMEEAAIYTKALKLKDKKREEDEKKLFGAPDDAIDDNIASAKGGDVSMEDVKEVVVIDEPTANNAAGKTHKSMAVDSETPIVDDPLWEWSDADQVIFRDIERIDVNDPNAAKLVTEARINGTPLVLVGHVGWANFAKRWLTEEKKNVAKKQEKIQQALKSEECHAKSEEGGEANPIESDSNMPATDKSSNADDTSAKMDVDEMKEESTAVDLTVDAADDGEAKATESDSKMPAKGEISDADDTSSKMDVEKISDNSPTIDTSAKATADEKKEDSTSIDTSVKSSAGEKMPAAKPVQEEGKKQPSVASKGENKASSKPSSPPSDDLLDLSKNYQLDIKKMIKDIGAEDVPVIKRNYNEEKPIHGKVPAEKFLTNCWPSPDSEASDTPQQQEKTTKNQRNPSNLYLHQWQFPLSDTAGRKLCHHNNPLPNGIMGEDLLKYWLDLPQCKLDSPLQYIFMGRADTLSKLHRDPGGLEISIAPVVGQKECVLVHRDDGSNCLYHLTASLENIDLHKHPLLSQARTWRSVIQPGEILLMPYGTYHQCRNVTPCLSYSRFHLDTVNLLPFVQSLVNGDAPEIDHEEVLWNLTSELIKRADGVFDKVQTRVKAGLDEGDLISAEVVETVNTLRALRHFMREVARREEIRQIVKGSDSEAAKNSEEHNFGMLVDDVDMCLHEFRYRQSRVIPPFKPRRGKALKNTLSGASGGRKDVIKRDMSKFRIGNKPVVAFNTSLENNYTSLVNADLEKHFPNAAKDKVGESLIGDLVPGDKVFVKLEQKHVKAEVVEILPQMKSAYLSFEDYPSVYDEWQPYELVRLPTGAEIPPNDVKPGLVVIDLSNSNEYRAKIQSILDGPMARVKLTVSQHTMTRLVSPAMILGRYVPLKKRSKQTNAKKASEAAAAELKAAEPPIIRPDKVGQFVEVGRRGAARVIKVHGEPSLSHVDVRFILGTAHNEYMVPIELVVLAPELDPESGRGRRQASKPAAYSDEDEATSNASADSKEKSGLPGQAASSDEDEAKINASEPKKTPGGVVSPTATDSSVDLEVL